MCWCCHYHYIQFPSQVVWPWISSALFLVLQINLCSKETNCEKKKTTTTRKYWPVRSHTIISFGISKRLAVVDVLLAPFQLAPSQLTRLCCSNTLAYRFLSKRETARSLGQLLPLGLSLWTLTPLSLRFQVGKRVTTSRLGIKQRGISFGSIFILHSYESSWESLL